MQTLTLTISYESPNIMGLISACLGTHKRFKYGNSLDKYIWGLISLFGDS